MATSVRSCTATRSASPPPPTIPKTRSPTFQLVTLSPISATVPRDLEPRNVLRRPERHRVLARPLGQVGRVQPSVLLGDDHLALAGHGVGPFLDVDDLRAAGAREHDGSHRLIATYLVSRYSSMPSKPPSRPKPGLLDAAERRGGVGDEALVEADHAGLERLASRGSARSRSRV